MLDELIRVETRHVAFWQEFFGLRGLDELDLGRRLKLFALTAVCRLFGAGAIHVVLEAIEVHGVRKYLRVWSRYAKDPLGAALREILDDEFKHEDMVVTADAERRISPEKVRNVFLGLNDGLVEILGAVSGFFAAFGNPMAVLAAGLTVAVAGRPVHGGRRLHRHQLRGRGAGDRGRAPSLPRRDRGERVQRESAFVGLRRGHRLHRRRPGARAARAPRGAAACCRRWSPARS